MGSSWEKIMLRTSDKEIFTVESKVMFHSEIIKQMVNDGYKDTIIPIDNIDAKTFNKIIEYCKMHTDFEGSKDDLKNWDDEFSNMDVDILYDLMMAANFLEIKSLLDLLFNSLANMIKGKSIEEIRRSFKIKDHGFTPNEEEEFRKEHPNLFEEKKPSSSI